MRYALVLARNAFYLGRPREDDAVVLASPLFDLAVAAAMFAAFLAIGTIPFVRREKNRL
jgi:hypothetical protein